MNSWLRMAKIINFLEVSGPKCYHQVKLEDWLEKKISKELNILTNKKQVEIKSKTIKKSTQPANQYQEETETAWNGHI